MTPDFDRQTFEYPLRDAVDSSVAFRCVAEASLSVRSQHGIRRNGVFTGRALVRTPIWQLIQTRGVGEKSLKEITTLQLALKQYVEQEPQNTPVCGADPQFELALAQ